MGAERCVHCRRPADGYASSEAGRLCHPDNGLDCYHLVTVYKHPTPCVCRDALLVSGDRIVRGLDLERMAQNGRDHDPSMRISEDYEEGYQDGWAHALRQVREKLCTHADGLAEWEREIATLLPPRPQEDS